MNLSILIFMGVIGFVEFVLAIFTYYNNRAITSLRNSNKKLLGMIERKKITEVVKENYKNSIEK